MKRALITGITGQDGSYLAELLLDKGYEVHGMIRRASTFNTRRIDHLYKDPHDADSRLFLHYGDLTGAERLTDLVYTVKPDEIYHLGAQSHVKVSFDMPQHTALVTGLGTTHLLDAIRRSGITTRFYNAASSEMFGDAPPPQDERTPLAPRSPYAAAKAYGFWMSRMYRDAYGIFACNGMLFNHESPRRGEIFVTRKITRGVATILAGKQKRLFLGNLDAERDWGYAPEYVEAMWLMLQQERPDDYVIGTGESRSVREFAEAAFAYVGLDARECVEIDPRYFRPLEVQRLRADPARARERLGWSPRITFDELVRVMVDADLEAAGLPHPGGGRRALAEKFGAWHRWQTSVTTPLAAAERGDVD
ncbi:MAG TPA: GDP-mannose 4,6-dehydratase [Methylomirabilota bacterium]